MIWEGKVQTPFAVVQRAKNGFREWKAFDGFLMKTSIYFIGHMHFFFSQVR